MTEHAFTVASARRAAERGDLADWVTSFLASPGSDNEALAAAFAFDRAVYLGPVLFALDQLTPLAGPDPDEVVVPIDEDEWEDDIDSMAEEVEEGWEPPPLLVSHRDGQFLLEDGNHRYETLRRAHEPRAWAILVFHDETERDDFLESEHFQETTP
jgi:hypothetical protein